MPEPMHLGNDVVDRGDSRLRGKSGDERFLRRVFAPAERDTILSAPDPDLALWSHWAGKEAAFKSASKALGAPPVFNHPEFRVMALEPVGMESASAVFAPGSLALPTSGEPGTISPSPIVLTGRVAYREMAFALVLLIWKDLLHAVSWSGAAELLLDAPAPPHPSSPIQAGLAILAAPDGDWREALRPQFSQREWFCVSHVGSALTRMAARDALAAALPTKVETLEIGCGPGPLGRRIPRVFLDGQEADVELTLSHYGRYQAWAFRVS